jgi:hypothetical protein
MTIEVNCECGAKLKAKPELSGKRVKCPTCAKTLTVPDTSTPLAGPLVAADAADDPLGLGAIAFDSSSIPAKPRTEQTLPVPRPVDRPNSTGRSDRSRGAHTRGSTSLDMVAGGFSVLHGVMASYNAIQMILMLGKASLLVGPQVIFSFTILQSFASAIASVCILVAGIGLLAQRKKWALKLGLPASIVFLVLMGLNCAWFLWFMVMMAKIEGLALLSITVFIRMLPRFIAFSIGPALLIYISQSSNPRR